MTIDAPHEQPAHAHAARASRPLARYLTGLLGIAALPLLVLVALLSILQVANEREDFDAANAMLARNVATALDYHLAARIGALDVLAHAPVLADPVRWRDLYPMALAYASSYGSRVLLLEVGDDVSVLFDTRVGLDGDPPPLPIDPQGTLLTDTITRSRATVGARLETPARGERAVAIAVPAADLDEARHVLIALFDTVLFERRLAALSVDGGYGVALFDAGGELIAARPGGASPAADAHRYTASPGVAPWSAVVTVPEAAYRTPVRHAVGVVLVVALVAVLLATAGGLMAARRLRRAVSLLAAAPDARVPPPDIDEFAAARHQLVQAAAARRDSERRFRATFEHAAAGIAHVAPDGSWLRVNDKLCHMLGYREDELIGGRFQELTHPEDIDASLQLVRRMLAGASGESSLEKRYLRKDGTVLWALLTVALVRDADGAPEYFVAVLQDIGERKRMELSLAAKTEELERYFAGSPDIIAIVETDGRLRRVNPEWQRTLGYRAEQAVGMNVMELVHPDDLERSEAAMQRLAAGEPVLDFVNRCRRADGDWRSIEWRVTPQGGLLFVVARDITWRLGAEQALRESEERLRLTVDAVRMGMFEWDITADRVTWSRWHEELWGFPADAEGGSYAHYIGRVHEQDRPGLDAAVRDCMAAARPFAYEFRVVWPDGSVHWLASSGRFEFDAGGTPRYLRGVVFDITTRRQAEESLRRSEAYRSRLFTQMADGVLVYDLDLRLVDANEQALATLGIDRESLLRQRLPDLLATSEPPPADEDRWRVGAPQPVHGEAEFRRGDGSSFPGEFSASRLDDARCLVVLRDISERRGTERALLGYQLELADLAQRLLEQEKRTTRRIAQQLHDHLGQTLAVARLHLDNVLATSADALPPALHAQCRRMTELLDRAVRDVRRVLADLRPPLLDERGLAAALDNEIRSRAVADSAIDVLLEVDADVAARRWPDDVEYGAFMVAREAIANAIHHSAGSLVRVVLDGDADHLVVEVLDDGIGIPGALEAGRTGHLGIVGMRERAAVIGARFAIAAAGQGGTRVTLEWSRQGP